MLSFVSEMEKNPVRIHNEMLVDEIINQDYRFLRNKNVEKELECKEKFQKYEKQKFFEQSLMRQRHVSKIDYRGDAMDFSDDAEMQKRFQSLKKSNVRDAPGNQNKVAATRQSMQVPKISSVTFPDDPTTEDDELVLQNSKDITLKSNQRYARNSTVLAGSPHRLNTKLEIDGNPPQGLHAVVFNDPSMTLQGSPHFKKNNNSVFQRAPKQIR